MFRIMLQENTNICSQAHFVHCFHVSLVIFMLKLRQMLDGLKNCLFLFYDFLPFEREKMSYESKYHKSNFIIMSTMQMQEFVYCVSSNYF